LNVRDAEGKNPLRVIICSELNFSPESNIFFDKNVILAVTDRADKKKIDIFSSKGIEIIELKSENGKIPLKSLIKKLDKKNIISVLCEGGSSLASSLINEKAADKIILTIAPKIIGKGLDPFPLLVNSGLENAVKLNNVEYKNIDDDLIIIGYPDLYNRSQ
jgi:diaminohydroxyphosphoribosylaminopyrimidine deaminase / 5-amino-6-(5-phosphoribosylamino)uracil reductase